MIGLIIWYFLVTLLGLAAWPLLFRLLPGLPDRGYTLSRAAGLLLVGYVFWLLTSLGLMHNSTGGMLLSLLIVAGVAIWRYRAASDSDDTLVGWLRENRLAFVIGEAVFALAFVGWAVVRAYNPELNATERPMELAFINGIRASAVFPPQDPWLAGYAISYYYFGYVMAAMLADLSGLATAVAFNLMIALLFALMLLGAYGIVFNLISLEKKGKASAVIPALLGPLMVGIMGNLEGLFELLRALRALPGGFLSWLDLVDINTLPAEPLWPPSTWRGWWWWRASRVIQDRDLTGLSIGLQPIDEFPMFSFLLGDMHPHVLALPFVLLSLGLALNLLAQRSKISREQFILYAVSFGGLAFINTWDVLFYLLVLLGARALWEWRERGDAKAIWWPALRFVLGIGVAAALAYLPWYISFSSQAGGILPNPLFPTRLRQFAVMFGIQLFIIVWYLIDRAARREMGVNWRLGAGLALGLLAILALLMWTIWQVMLYGIPGIQLPYLPNTDAQNFLLASTGQSSLGAATSMALTHRLSSPWTALLLTAVLGLALSLLLRPRTPLEDPSPSSQFVLLLILTGTLLTLGPEFVYLRDVFGQRLNTIFKFYYATWLLWGLAGAYALYRIGKRRTVGAYIFLTLSGVLIAAGLVYPALAIPEKIGYFSQPPTLNGVAYIEELNPSDYSAILWIQDNLPPDAIILEAVGGSYTYYGRISSNTGRPTLLGWPGHELQWRGSLALAGSRESDVRTIYSTADINQAMVLLETYGVDYVYVGGLESESGYSTAAGIEKFERYLTPVFRDDNAVIYRVGDR
jgi:YYY domain-containing protein